MLCLIEKYCLAEAKRLSARSQHGYQCQVSFQCVSPTSGFDVDETHCRHRTIELMPSQHQCHSA
jgi:hypothetical protein